MYALEGGSVGFQIGGEATDLILLVMNDRGMESILSSKVKLGADASVAGGPKGRDASADTDAWMRAEILSYSRSRGLFAGVSLEGSTIRPDDDASEQVYGHAIKAKDIVRGEHMVVPVQAVISSTFCRRAHRATNRNALRISSWFSACRDFSLSRQAADLQRTSSPQQIGPLIFAMLHFEQTLKDGCGILRSSPSYSGKTCGDKPWNGIELNGQSRETLKFAVWTNGH